MVKKNNKVLKNSLKYISLLSLVNLFYLNLFLPLKLSLEQIFLILTEVVRVCDEKGVDIAKLSTVQLDEIIALSLNSVKQTFKQNGFRFIPEFIKPAYAGEMVPFSKISPTLQIKKPNPYSSAISSIIHGNSLIGNIRDCLNRLAIICKDFGSELPTSGKFYLASKGIFLMLNLTNAQYNVFRYIIWGGTTIIQVFYFPGKLYTKLPMIFSSLMRDCHIQIFDQIFEIMGPIFLPVMKPIIGIVYRLPFIGSGWYIPLNNALNWGVGRLGYARDKIKTIPLLAEGYNFIEAAFNAKLVMLLNQFRIQFEALSSDYRGLIKFAIKAYHEETKKSLLSFILDSPNEIYGLSNLPVAYKITGHIGKALGRTELNVTSLVRRTGIWLKDFQELDKILKNMPIAERRRFETWIARKWMRGDDISYTDKIIKIFQRLAKRFITRG